MWRLETWLRISPLDSDLVLVLYREMMFMGQPQGFFECVQAEACFEPWDSFAPYPEAEGKLRTKFSQELLESGFEKVCHCTFNHKGEIIDESE